jgi:hypothetical protein
MKNRQVYVINYNFADGKYSKQKISYTSGNLQFILLRSIRGFTEGTSVTDRVAASILKPEVQNARA